MPNKQKPPGEISATPIGSQYIPGGTRSAFKSFSKLDIEQAISDRFEQQVNRYRDKLAVTDQFGSSLTYGELNNIANRIGHTILAAIGDGEMPVVIMIDQNASLLAAIIGVLKAGKFYVPVEIGSSETLVRHVLSNTAAPLLLTNNANLAAATKFRVGNLKIINIDDISNNCRSDNIGLPLSPDRLAYIYYTSGSTGAPKGVLDCHRNVLHNVMRYTNKLFIGSDDRISLVQPPGFSGAVSNIFCALLNGASVFPFDLRRGGATNLANWVAQEKLTMFHSVPVVFEWLTNGNQKFPALRIVRLEGDQAYTQHVHLFRERFDAHCRLVIGLGATETGIATQFVCSPNESLCDAIIPIGYATEDLEISILDSAQCPVEQGAIGQIAVNSRYLAISYWNQPELTRINFRNDLVSGPERTYLTGDLGRRRADGSIEYCGRKNFQVSIRGQAVDIAMVEETIRNAPGITAAAVASHSTNHAPERLIAYIVPEDSVSFNLTKLRLLIGEKLDGPNLPTIFVTLPTLPFNENNKLDRNALPPPPQNRPQLDISFVAPRNSVEVHMKQLWEDILEVKPIGIRDDFFDLGGDSLLAGSLVLEIEQVFGKSFPLDAFWVEGATIEKCVSMLRQSGKTDFWNGAVPIKPNGTQPALFVVHTFGGHLICYAPLSRHLNSDQPVYGLQALGADGSAAPQFSIPDMAKHCIEMMQQIQPTGPYRITGYSSGGLIAYEMARILSANGEHVSRLVLLDAILPRLGILGFTKSLLAEARAGDFRRLQERMYYLVLYFSGLSALRKLRKIDEAHRWAEFCHRPGRYSGNAFLVQSRETEKFNRYESSWNELISGTISVATIEGDHMSIMQDPVPDILAERVQSYLSN